MLLSKKENDIHIILNSSLCRLVLLVDDELVKLFLHSIDLTCELYIVVISGGAGLIDWG